MLFSSSLGLIGLHIALLCASPGTVQTLTSQIQEAEAQERGDEPAALEFPDDVEPEGFKLPASTVPS